MIAAHAFTFAALSFSFSSGIFAAHLLSFSSYIFLLLCFFSELFGRLCPFQRSVSFDVAVGRKEFFNVVSGKRSLRFNLGGVQHGVRRCVEHVFHQPRRQPPLVNRTVFPTYGPGERAREISS